MNILGVSAFYHDSAACLVRDGEIIAAAQEERFSRKKHDQSFPIRAIEYCLKEGKIRSAREIDSVAYYEWPLLRFERILTTFLQHSPRGFDAFRQVIPVWAKEKLWIEPIVRTELSFDGPLEFVEHHQSHAASAFFPSPFSEAAILTLDGVGEWATGSWGVGKGNGIEIAKEMKYPHSLGMLYSAFTYYLGFKVNSGEYKVMGLAPYGEPRFVDTILSELVNLKEDGSFRLNMRYFDYPVGFAMTNAAFDRVFRARRRVPEARLTQWHMDVARSIQEVTNEIVLRMARHVRAETSLKRLCMAGGVALNCVANGLILERGIFDELWVQPAAGDAGGAVGAALHVWYQRRGNQRTPNADRDGMKGALLGPSYSDGQIGDFLDANRISYSRVRREELPATVARLIAEGRVIGWFQGRMEFGPRALGARSIIGDARSKEMQAVMNLKIKFRESFRPFAPSVLEEHSAEFFDMKGRSPYMLLIFPVNRERHRKMTPAEEHFFGIEKLNVVRSDIPAVTHVDYSARVQTVSREDNPLYYDTIKSFYDLTGCPVIINTSFNVRGEPICASPEDAYRCFMRTNMDFLVMGSFLLDKTTQPANREGQEWMNEFDLD